MTENAYSNWHRVMTRDELRDDLIKAFQAGMNAVYDLYWGKDPVYFNNWYDREYDCD